MKTGRYAVILLTGMLIVVADQLSKWYIDSTFVLYESVSVIDGFFNITYIRNPGAAFGLLAGAHPVFRSVFFIGLSCVAVGLIVFFIARYAAASPRLVFPLSLICGGAVGNVLDRIRLGEVVDFLDVHYAGYHWPAFNIADSAISVGAVLLLVEMFRRERHASGEIPPSAAGG